MIEITKEWEGRYAMCWYWKIRGDYAEGLELYFCKIIKVGDEYCTCQLYYGEELDTKKVKGTFNDVCRNDIVEMFIDKTKA